MFLFSISMPSCNQCWLSLRSLVFLRVNFTLLSLCAQIARLGKYTDFTIGPSNCWTEDTRWWVDFVKKAPINIRTVPKRRVDFTSLQIELILMCLQNLVSDFQMQQANNSAVSIISYLAPLKLNTSLNNSRQPQKVKRTTSLKVIKKKNSKKCFRIFASLHRGQYQFDFRTWRTICSVFLASLFL